MVVIWTLMSAVLLVVAAGLVAPAFSDLISVLRIAVGLGRKPRSAEPGVGGAVPSLLLLVPAHNEEQMIEGTITDLLAMRYPSDRRRIVVVADNCTDRTAEIARDAGVECLERTDTVNRGKPHAMAWALEQIGLDGFNAVVIVDADTRVDVGFAETMAARAPLDGITVQGDISVRNAEDNSLTRMQAVLTRSRHQFSFPLKQRAGLNVPLQGPGATIGADILRANGWQAFSICEDWEMYAIYTQMGIEMQIDPQARMFIEEVRGLKQAQSQKERWAAGKIAVFYRSFFPILLSRNISLHQKLDVLGELFAVGPAVHLGAAGLLAAAAFFLPVPGSNWILLLLLLGILRVALYAGLAVLTDPQPVRTALSFLYLPFYTVWRVGVQVVSLRMLGDKPWVRTARNS